MSNNEDRPAHEKELPIRIVDRRWWVQGASDASADGTPARKPTYVEELERQLAEKDEQLRATIAKYREAASEFDAARVRGRRDVAKEVERGKRAILAELLEVVDNLDRALDAARANPDIDTMRLGVEMVRSQFLDRLEGFGVTRLDALGAVFDPAVHEAVTTVPTSDPAQVDRVLGVIREGYRVGDDLLRPAIVAVGQTPKPDDGHGSATPSARA